MFQIQESLIQNPVDVNNKKAWEQILSSAFETDGRNLFQDKNTPDHRARAVTEGFDEDENDVNHQSSLFARLNPNQPPVGDFGLMG